MLRIDYFLFYVNRYYFMTFLKERILLMKKAMKCDNNVEEARISKNISKEEPSKALSVTIAGLLNKEAIELFPYLEASIKINSNFGLLARGLSNVMLG